MLTRFCAFQQQAILQAIQSSGCPLTDIACMCKNTDFVDELVGQIPQLCSAGDIARKSSSSLFSQVLLGHSSRTIL